MQDKAFKLFGIDLPDVLKNCVLYSLLSENNKLTEKTMKVKTTTTADPFF